jgi:AAA+ ATPase superfamily predicted ATPase
MPAVTNPFPVSGYHGPALFCNRRNEVKKLRTNIENGVHTTLVSIRRMGKTGLLYHLFYLLERQKDVHCLYVDIYPTQKQKDLINQLATAILNAFPPKKTLGKKALEFITSLRPVISYDQFTGSPEVTLTLSQPKQQEQSLASLLQFLDRLNTTVVLALDEFQQISQYPETNTEAMLRTLIQPLKNVRFVFSGSSRHVLTQMFTQNKRPFFGSTQMLDLAAIEKQDYTAFIKKHFESHRRKISPEALDFICGWTRLHTYYTQVVCNRLFSEGFSKIDLQTVQEICLQILNEQEVVFFQYRTLLTAAQWQLLKAIAKEEKVYQPTSKDFMVQHKLGTPSNVQRSLDALLTKEMVYKEEQKEGNCYLVYDCFLSRWLQRL